MHVIRNTRTVSQLSNHTLIMLTTKKLPQAHGFETLFYTGTQGVCSLNNPSSLDLSVVHHSAYYSLYHTSINYKVWQTKNYGGKNNSINDINKYAVNWLTSRVSVLSNKTTRPPRSPVARWSPDLSNSIADMISTANIRSRNKSKAAWEKKHIQNTSAKHKSQLHWKENFHHIRNIM